MATYESVTTLNRIAGEDLRGDVFSLLTVENDNGQAKVVKTTDATQFPVGILAEDPFEDLSTDGVGVPVTLLFGQIIVKAAGAITAAQYLVASDETPGAVIGVNEIPAGSFAIGTADHNAVAGDIIEVFGALIPGPAAATP